MSTIVLPGRRRRVPLPRAAVAARWPVHPARDHHGLRARRRCSRRCSASPDPQEQSLRLKFRPPVWEERGTLGRTRSAPTASGATCSRAWCGARACRWPPACVTVLLASAFGAAVGLVAGLLRRARRRRADAHDRRHALVPGHPARADPRGHRGPELRQRGARDRGDPVGALRARDPRAGPHADGARLHRAGAHRGRRRLADHHAPPRCRTRSTRSSCSSRCRSAT